MVDSTRNRNEYQECFRWGLKAAGALGWQPYNHHVLAIMKSESLNFTGPSGPVQASTVIDLPLLLGVLIIVYARSLIF